MSDNPGDIVLRTLRRTRQVRQFTDTPVAESALRAILEVARWTGSSMNQQPWTFIVIRDAAIREQIGKVSRYARHLRGAPLAIAIAMRGEDSEGETYDEGRAAERILIAATALDLGAGIGWVEGESRAEAHRLLGVEAPAFVRTIVSIGHPTDAARQPRSGPGTGRKALVDIVRER